jgi:hypothetical protein
LLENGFKVSKVLNIYDVTKRCDTTNFNDMRNYIFRKNSIKASEIVAMLF